MLEPSVDIAADDHEVRYRCPAKVNLALSVGPREAEGYHPVASWMAALTFGDILILRPASDGRTRFDIAFDADAPQRQPVDWPLDKDLAFRAHRLMEKQAGATLAVRATLRKRVPAGAGLAGGSADAAGMLMGLSSLFALGASSGQLADLGRTLGSDVAFALAAMQGTTTALATGRGGRLEPMRLRRPLYLALVLPPLHCPTGEVYAAFDQGGPVGARVVPQRVRTLAGQWPIPPDQLFNDLAEPAMRVIPPLRAARKQVEAAVGLPVHITGSGAAMFVLARGVDHARQLARRIHDVARLPAVATSTVF